MHKCCKQSLSDQNYNQSHDRYQTAPITFEFSLQFKLIAQRQSVNTSITLRRQGIVQESQELALNLIEKSD
jgi:hypothetical protein